VTALEHLFDPTVEPFDHTVCIREFRRGQAVLDVQTCIAALTFGVVAAWL
jgi:hypothetical protein